MANLTGEYDVAAEIGMPLLNRIVAAMHANQDPRFPIFPHSISTWLDDTPRGPADPVPAAERTGVQARVEVQVSTPTIAFPTPERVLDPGLVLFGASRGSAPPSSMARLRGAGDIVVDWSDWDIFEPLEYPKVTAEVRIRAWVRDQTQPPLPEFIDGYLRVTVGLVRSDVPGGGSFVTLERGRSLAVRFQPAPGTTVSPDERLLVEALVRNFIRSDADPPTFEVALPPQVRQYNFRLQPGAPTPSFGLAFLLQDRAVPASMLGVGEGFIPGGAEFGIAVGRDYLVSMMRAQLLSGLPGEYSFSGGWGTIRGKVRPDWANATFDLEWGRAVLTIGGTGHVTYGPPLGGATTDNFSFTAKLGFGLVIVDGIPEPVAAGDPELDFSGLFLEVDFVTGRARSELRSSRDAALAAGRAEMRRALDVGRVFDEILGGVLPAPPAVRLTSVQIQPDGVVVGGRLDAPAASPAVVTHLTRDGKLDALESWIPGGTIERFEWRARRGTWGAAVEEHRFVSENSAIAFLPTCLTVVGTRVVAGGLAPVSETRCAELVLTLPVLPPREDGRRPLLPITATDALGRLRVAGHYDPWASGVTPSRGPTCVLVHFADGEWAKAEEALRAALKARKKEGALIVLGVVPGPDPAYGEADLDGVPLLLTGDAEGRWAAAYEVGAAPATVLVGPRGDVVWRAEGPLDPAKAARAADKHAEEGSEVSRHSLHAAVRPNDRVPEFPIPRPGGAELSMRRLGGSEVWLVFWSSRSEPSVRHLRHLGRALREAKAAPPLVIGVGDGEDVDGLEALAQGERFPFPVIADPNRTIARRFGIGCWPSTVVIGRDQRIGAVLLGAVNLPQDPAGDPGKAM